MSKLISRLLIFFIGIPVIIGLVFFNAYNHILLHLAICATTVISTLELYSIFSNKLKLIPKGLLVFCSVLIPFAAALECVIPAFTKEAFILGDEIISYALILSLIIILAYEVLSADSFEDSIGRICSSFFIVIYTGFIISFISRMTVFSQILADNESVLITKDVSFQAITIFLLMVFLCDSLAWLFGITLGKGNRGIIKASPNKSIAGFIGGFAGSIIAGLLGYFVWPEIFGGSILKIIIMGAIIAFTSITGDLAESVLKRSADCKDSGFIIPGRGGILDSIDSILTSAPVYFLLFKLFFGPLA